ncbi:DUF5994 family protein [Saccharothrix sp. BKS2]
MTLNQPSPATSPTTGPGCRWTAKPRAGAQGSVDGGWWPWSTDPMTEFPLLITAMAELGRPVLRISYNLDTWDPCERKLVVRDAVVRTEGFHTGQPHSVTLVGPDRTRTLLLVVPPTTPGGAARAALRAAADVDSTATVEDILNWNDVRVPAARPGTAAAPGLRAVNLGETGHREADDDPLDLREVPHGLRRETHPTGDRVAS